MSESTQMTDNIKEKILLTFKEISGDTATISDEPIDAIDSGDGTHTEIFNVTGVLDGHHYDVNTFITTFMTDKNGQALTKETADQVVGISCVFDDKSFQRKYILALTDIIVKSKLPDCLMMNLDKAAQILLMMNRDTGVWHFTLLDEDSNDLYVDESLTVH